MKAAFAAVLFDLDGCLVDSAPDLAGALNDLRMSHGFPPLSEEALRPMVGTGARGMVGAGFGAGPDDAEFPALRDDFLCRYASRILARTVVFPGMGGLLRALQARGVAWGVVTNKASRFALPLLHGLGLSKMAGAVVCGDTTEFAKPHPGPLWEAARRLNLRPAQCIYVGDDLRDIEAALAAGMFPVAARWGYLGTGLPVDAWGAEIILDSPVALRTWLEID